MSALCQKRTFYWLLDHLIGASEERCRHNETECLGGLEIDNKLVFVWCLHGQVGRLLTLEDTIDIAGRLPELVNTVGTVGEKAAMAARRRAASPSPKTS
jgi:hypothetical protein